MKNVVERQRAFYANDIDKFYAKLDGSKLTDEFKLIATATRVHRGKMKDVNHFIKMLEIIQTRDNSLIRRDLMKDKAASHVDDNGNFTYSGIGKTAGLKTYAILSMDATDEQIVWFYRALKRLKKPMAQIIAKMEVCYGLDFRKDIG